MCRPVPGTLSSWGSASPTKHGSVVTPSPCLTAAICVSPSVVRNGTPVTPRSPPPAQAGTGQYFFPSKLLSALAFARPVLGVADADSELSLAMEGGEFGVQVPPGQPRQLAEALDLCARLEPGVLRRMGEEGRRYGERFAWGRVLADFEGELKSIMAEKQGRKLNGQR